MSRDVIKSQSGLFDHLKHKRPFCDSARPELVAAVFSTPVPRCRISGVRTRREGWNDKDHHREMGRRGGQALGQGRKGLDRESGEFVFSKITIGSACLCGVGCAQGVHVHRVHRVTHSVPRVHHLPCPGDQGQNVRGRRKHIHVGQNEPS